MELSLITPVNNLEYTKLLPGRFCIAPVAAKYPTYRDYFAEASHAGYNVTLDNGVFESDKMSDAEYIDLARYIKPKVIVIPDTINAPANENWQAALVFIEEVVEAQINGLPLDVELMYVPQCEGGDVNGFWNGVDSAIESKKLQWIGICRDACFNAFGHRTNTRDQELNRFYFAAELQRMYARNCILKKKWHFLGVGRQLHMLQYFWFVDSMDTASLFYQSVLGNIVTEEGILPGELKRPKDYFQREFNVEESVLSFNCQEAQHWGQKAGELKRILLGGRL